MQKEQSEVGGHSPIGKVSSIGKGVAYISNGKIEYILG